MTQYADVFKRYEKKYMLNMQQYQSLMLQLKGHMANDEYGLHTICNIYYDTSNYELIRTSIEKPVYKEKLRLRSYGVPKSDDPVFIEIKKKFDGIVYKRRVKLPLYEAQAYLAYGKYPLQSNQILNEIDWFMKIHKPDPKIFIAYDRSAFFGNENPNLRITFDQNIRFRESALDLSKGSWGAPVIGPDKVLMEIKIPGAMPVWLSSMLSGLGIFATSFSKYGTCYKDHILHKTYKTGGIYYA